MLNCKRIKKLIVKHVECGCDHHAEARIAAHIQKCDSCRQEYEAYKNMLECCAKLPEIDLPSDFHGKLHNKLVRAAQNFESSSNRPEFNISNKMIGIASCIAVVILMILTFGGMNFWQLHDFLKFDSRTALKSSAARDSAINEGMADGTETTDESKGMSVKMPIKNANVAGEQNTQTAHGGERNVPIEKRTDIGTDTSISQNMKGQYTVEDIQDMQQITIFSLPQDNMAKQYGFIGNRADLSVTADDADESAILIRSIVSDVGVSIKSENNFETQRDDSKYRDARSSQTANSIEITAEMLYRQYLILIEKINQQFPECISSGIAQNDSTQQLCDDDTVTVVITILGKV